MEAAGGGSNSRSAGFFLSCSQAPGRSRCHSPSASGFKSERKAHRGWLTVAPGRPSAGHRQCGPAPGLSPDSSAACGPWLAINGAQVHRPCGLFGCCDYFDSGSSGLLFLPPMAVPLPGSIEPVGPTAAGASLRDFASFLAHPSQSRPQCWSCCREFWCRCSRGML